MNREEEKMENCKLLKQSYNRKEGFKKLTLTEKNIGT